ncbi:UPF0415 protein [Elsinoe australis]|uniref:UPF0415 protein n=1 Tax=Elsinoe australis TaxID=40998 RepID=A0A2P7Z3Q8_9PEZI|nr:UPF0415 protein [Elsinoe australis]
MNLPIRSNGPEQEASTRSPTPNGNIAAQSHPLSFLQGSGSAEVLLERCQGLWNEIETFRDQLKRRHREQTVEMSHYRGVVRSELKNLERLAGKQREAREQREAEKQAQKGGDEANGHAKVPVSTDGDHAGQLLDESEDELPNQQIASSNLPFLESVWNSAKATSGLIAMQKRFYYGEDVDRKTVPRGVKFRRRRGSQSHLVKTGKALVDVVAADGLEWIKVSLVTNHRMIMDKAREGWVEDSSDEDDSDEENIKSPADDPDGDIPIVKMGEAMLQASKEVRIRTKYPTVRMILPKVVEGELPQIDKIINRLRTKGIVVECNPQAVASRSLESVLERMITDPYANFTPTLNIDCTILLGLVSDFSHSEVESEPWFHRALKRQVEIEDKEALLPNSLYPAIVGRKLVCTAEAAKRMGEIVDTIGTPGEKVRTGLFMGSVDETEYSEEVRQERRARLAECSKFDVPQDLRLPITIVDKDDVDASGLPAVAPKVKETLTAINQSVFMYGWSTGYTTITSNRTVVKGIENVLDKHAKNEHDWPKIWLCPTARSLVGKEKGRRE